MRLKDYSNAQISNFRLGYLIKKFLQIRWARNIRFTDFVNRISHCIFLDLLPAQPVWEDCLLRWRAFCVPNPVSRVPGRRRLPPVQAQSPKVWARLGPDRTKWRRTAAGESRTGRGTGKTWPLLSATAASWRSWWWSDLAVAGSPSPSTWSWWTRAVWWSVCKIVNNLKIKLRF